MEVQATSPLLLISLQEDLLHQIIKCCSSMNDFLATIQTSRRMYGVYKGYPSSIIYSVACNHMGMTKDIFSLAFGLVLYHERARVLDPPVKERLGEDELSASHLNPPRFQKMVSNHGVVAQLEKEFSRR
jgi:hypothetical protein